MTTSLHISDAALTNLLFDGQAKVGDSSVTLAQVLKKGIDPADKGKLYEMAKGAFKEAKKELKHGDNDKAMEILVRAYTILTSKKLGASPEAKTKTWGEAIFGSGERREHARMLKESKELFASHFDSYLKATQQRVEQKQVVKGQAAGGTSVKDAASDTHSKLSMLNDLAGNTAKIDSYMKSFSPAAQKTWNELKKQLAEKKLGSDNHNHHVDPKAKKALTLWTQLRTQMAISTGKGDNISSVLKDDPDGKSVDEKTSDFLTGRTNIRSLLSRGDASLGHTPLIARTLAQFDSIKQACQASPSLKDAFTKLEVALLRQNAKLIETLVKQIAKESRHPEFVSSITQKGTAAPQLAISLKTVDTQIGGKGGYDNTRKVLERDENKLSKELAKAAKENYVKTPHAKGIDAHTVTIGQTNSVVSAAPKNEAEVTAYFNNLESNNTNIIVTLHEDHEKGMNGFHLLPDIKGEVVKHGKTEITLVDKQTHKIENSQDDLHTITKSTINVVNNGKSTTYEVIKLDHWDKENTPLDMVALRELSSFVDTLEDGNKGHLAITSNEGTGRPATFLLYHELAHAPKESKLEDTIQAHLDFNRTRPGASDKQFATVVGALHQAKTPNLHPQYTERVKKHEDIHSRIANNLMDTPKSQFLQFFMRNDAELRGHLSGGRNSATPEEALKSFFERQMDEKFIGHLPPGAQQKVKQRIAHLSPESLERLTYVLTSTDENIAKLQRNFESLENAHNFNAEFPEYKNFSTLNELVRSQVESERNGAPPPALDFAVLERLDNAIKYVDLTKADKTKYQHISELENSLKKERISKLYELKDQINANPHLLMDLTPKMRQLLGVDLIKGLTPEALAQAGSGFIKDLSKEQKLALSADQAEVLTDGQWKALLADKELRNDFKTEIFALMPRDQFTSVLEGLSPRKMLALIHKADELGIPVEKRNVDLAAVRHKKTEVDRFMENINPEGNPFAEKDWKAVRNALAEKTLEFEEFDEGFKDAKAAIKSRASKHNNQIKNEGFPHVVTGLRKYVSALEKIGNKTDRSGAEGKNVFTTGDVFTSRRGDKGSQLDKLNEYIAKIDDKSIQADKATRDELKKIEEQLLELTQKFGFQRDIIAGTNMFKALQEKLNKGTNPR